MKDYKFTVVFDKDEDGKILAICPSLEGCYTEGETIEEAEKLIEDAMKLHIEDRLVTGELIYDEVTAKKVRVTA